MPSPRPPREVLAFYYRGRANPAVSGAWKIWQGPNREAPDNDPVPSVPVLGMYDSHDPAVLAQHARWLKQAGVTGVILGFFNRPMWEDRDGGAKTLAAMHAQGLKLSVYIERPNGDLEGAKDDLRYLYAHGMADHPGWLRVGKRPVVFFYRGALRKTAGPVWREAARALAAEGRPEPILIGDVDAFDPAYVDKAQGLDGTHSWSIVEPIAGMTPPQMDAYIDAHYPGWMARAAGSIRCATVMPGWNDLLITRRPYPRPTTDRFGTGTLAALWRGAIRYKADFVLINSFNATHNGCDIEPSRMWGETALNANAVFARRFLGRA